MENEDTKFPVVGMPATYCIGSDRWAGSIVSVSKSGRTLGFSDRRDGAMIETFSLRQNGRFYRVGCPMGQSGTLRLGVAEDYRDPSF